MKHAPMDLYDVSEVPMQKKNGDSFGVFKFGDLVLFLQILTKLN